ncbi:stalk domain-containing protein [Brevibacillus brevis]|uniref:stalk domain-containing protein n=1 Tax=Brevibacillus brevis TaxID=1393 RepID=UPI0037C5AE78
MIKKSKVVATLLSTAIALSASIPAVTAAEKNSSTQVEKTYSIVVNGKSMEVGSASEENGILSVQLAPIIKAMGDYVRYDVDTKTAIITQKDHTVVKITVGRSVAKVNNKDVLFSTKRVGNVIVPSSSKAIIVDGKLYVPVDALKNVFGYSIQEKEMDLEKIVLVQKSIVENGKLDPYPFPAGWIPPKVTAKWSSDKQANMKVLEKELEFANLGAGAAYSPYGRGPGTTSILLSASATENYDTLITISVWKGSNYLPLDNKIPYIAKELFRFYFPKEGSKLWQITDDAFNNKNIDKYLNKTLTYDDRQVKMMNVQGNLVIVVGKPGIKYDKDWNVIR